MQQLLEGVSYMHKNQIMHRDLKPSNLLVNRKGDLKICDFGLARGYKPNRCYTSPVITLNYRPPELLLGCRKYGLGVDIWSCGAIFGELLTRKIVIPGRDEPEYLENLWHFCGAPSERDWPEALQHDNRLCPGWREHCADTATGAERHATKKRKVLETFGMHEHAAPLIDLLFSLSPARRVTANAALDNDYFWEGERPLPQGDRALPWDVHTQHTTTASFNFYFFRTLSLSLSLSRVRHFFLLFFLSEKRRSFF